MDDLDMKLFNIFKKNRKKFNLHEKYEYFFLLNIVNNFYNKYRLNNCLKNIVPNRYRTIRVQNTTHLPPFFLYSLFQVQHLLCSPISTIYEPFNLSAPLGSLNKHLPPKYYQSYIQPIRALWQGLSSVSKYQIPVCMKILNRKLNIQDIWRRHFYRDQFHFNKTLNILGQFADGPFLSGSNLNSFAILTFCEF